MSSYCRLGLYYYICTEVVMTVFALC